MAATLADYSAAAKVGWKVERSAGLMVATMADQKAARRVVSSAERSADRSVG